MSQLKPILLAGAFASLALGTAQAQNGRRTVRNDQPAVHQMEILNGSSRTVRNFGLNLSPGESSSLRELDRLENESAFARDVLALKRQYVASERFLEPHRRIVQLDLYGRATTSSSSNSATATAAGVNPFGVGFPGLAPFGLGNIGGLASSVSSAASGDLEAETRSLAAGVGNEGTLKNSLAAVISQQATPSYAAALDRDYQRVALRAADSPRLQAALHLPTPEAARKERERMVQLDADLSSPTGVVLTLKGGDKIYGTAMKEAQDWITIDLLRGGSTRIRASEVVRIDQARKGGIAPASR